MSGRPRRSRVWLAGLLIVPIAAGFLLAGGGVGMLTGVVTAAAILLIAARAEVGATIEVAAPGPGVPAGLLVVAIAPIEDPRTAGIVAAIADPDRLGGGESGVLVIAPARSSALQRWTDDLDAPRFESQRVLAVSLASLAAAGISAEGRVGDGDPLQAAEDALRTYAAVEVVVVSLAGESGRAIAELERRLDRPLRRVVPSP